MLSHRFIQMLCASCLFTLLALVGGCGGGESGDGPAKPGASALPDQPKRAKPLVVCSLPVLGELARAVAGDLVEVHSLALPGEDPATFALRPLDLALIDEAAIVFIVSDQLERSVHERAGKLSTLVNLSQRQGAAAAATPADDRGAANRHVWMQREHYRGLGEAMLLELSRRLKLDDQCAARLREHLDKHSEAWRAAGDQLKAVRVPTAPASALTNDPAVQMFLDQLGFEPRLIRLDAQRIPTEADRAALDARLAQEKPALLAFDTSDNPALGEMLAELAGKHGIRLVTGLKGRWLDEPTQPTGTLVGVIRHNADLISRALKE